MRISYKCSGNLHLCRLAPAAIADTRRLRSDAGCWCLWLTALLPATPGTSPSPKPAALPLPAYSWGPPASERLIQVQR